LTGTVTGFVNGQNLASATTGTLQFTTPATDLSPPGTYPINGSGLTADFGNYVFVQAASNATALTLDPAALPPPNVAPSTPTPTNVNITFQNSGANLFHVSFTPNTNTAQNNNDTSPGSLAPDDAYTHNNGFNFPPISQYDANQYSDFKLPGYDNDDSESTIFTILARGVSPGHGGNYMIDGFWNGSEDTWPGAGNISLPNKLVFSNGAGDDVTPTVNDAFPIVAGKTDFAALLKNGPVMIGGPAGQTPAQWLLATGLAPDGKGIICDDTITGTLVELSYDPATETVGGITGVFDAKTKGFVSLADAGNDIPANDASGLAALQGFVPSTYFAVTVH
jgi:MBG domain-containing protein